MDEMNTLGEVSSIFKKSELNELNSLDKISTTCLLQQVLLTTCLLNCVKILPIIKCDKHFQSHHEWYSSKVLMVVRLI